MFGRTLAKKSSSEGRIQKLADSKVRDPIEMSEKIAGFTDEDLRSTNFRCLFCDVFYSEWGEYPFEIVQNCGVISFISAQIAQMHDFKGFCVSDCENFKPVKVKGQ